MLDGVWLQLRLTAPILLVTLTPHDYIKCFIVQSEQLKSLVCFRGIAGAATWKNNHGGARHVHSTSWVHASNLTTYSGVETRKINTCIRIARPTQWQITTWRNSEQITYYIFDIDYRMFTLDFPLPQASWNAGTKPHQTVNQSVYTSSTGEH